MAVSHRSLRLAVVALALASGASAQSQDMMADTSTATVISSLVLNLIIFSVEMTAFFILRPRFPKVFRPKTYLGLHEERVAPLPDSMFGWIPQFIKTPTTEILYKNGLEAYQFVAFCEMMVSGLVSAEPSNEGLTHTTFADLVLCSHLPLYLAPAHANLRSGYLSGQQGFQHVRVWKHWHTQE